MTPVKVRKSSLSGPDRATLYRVALGTGFRRDELGSLAPEAFRLGQNPPVIVCAAAYTKNGQRGGTTDPGRPGRHPEPPGWRPSPPAAPSLAR